MPSFLRRCGRVYTCARPVFIRWQLPYGLWTCPDGREVLFDRDYYAIASRQPGAAPEIADPMEWIDWVAQAWFYDDGVPERRALKAAQDALIAWDFLEPVMQDIATRLRPLRHREVQAIEHGPWRYKHPPQKAPPP